MLKQIFFLITLGFFSAITFGQDTGSIAGKLTDKDFNNEPLPFANVLIKGTSKGTTSDYDGLYEIADLEPGTYVVVFSFVGYETQEIEATVTAGNVTEINVPMGVSAAALDEVLITTVARKDSEVALLLEQKKAVTLETSIGSQELRRKGVGDAAAAVSKVTGISKQEGTGNVFVRGLGDRYNITTLNGLPLPSNNTSKKNINLDNFDTSIIESIGVDKTFNAQNYGDFGGANINIVSKNYSGNGFAQLQFSTSVNSEALSVNDFLVGEGPGAFGFYNQDIPPNPFDNEFETQFDPVDVGFPPLNFSLATQGGDTYDLGGNAKLSFYAVGSIENGFTFRTGVNRGAPNIATGLPNSDFDYDKYSYQTATTALVNVRFFDGERNTLKYNFSLLNNSEQKLEKFDGIIDREDDAPNGGGLIQRSTFDRTTIIVNQILGEHDLKENIDLDWAVAYNNVINLVPDRRQNTLLPDNPREPEGPKSFKLISAASDNHRFYQELKENELAANIAATYKFKRNDEDIFDGKVTVGYNGRFKDIDFEAVQFNYQILDIQNQPFVDPNNIDAYFEENDVNSGLYQVRTFRGPGSFEGALDPQTYGGTQNINAGYITLEYKFNPKLTLFAGFRGELINQFIEWDVVIATQGNDNTLDIFEWLPSLALKYELNEKQNLRFAASRTYTLPQFKERAPFLFQEEINQDSFGNPFLESSSNYNFDLRWEIFPENDEIVSVGVFGKYIENPINQFLVVSAANDFSFANTGDQATAFGAEIEVRKNLFVNERQIEENTLLQKLTIGGNVSYLNTKQDLDSNKVNEDTNGSLSAAFTNTSAPLQGASDLILNADLSFYQELKEDSDIRATVIANYFTDRIFALGSTGRGHLVDKGFVTLDFVTRYQLNKNLSLNLRALNLLNPLVERVNENAEGDLDFDNPAIPGFLENGPVTVLSYKKGVDVSIGLRYNF
ncbi:MAG: TonB-dependent receptor [Bacteroidota bacterium]